jgi:hypothetical protein
MNLTGREWWGPRGAPGWPGKPSPFWPAAIPAHGVA